MQTVVDVVAVALILAGSALALIAGLGLLRFPDVLSRLHAGTKPQVAGLLIILTGAVLRLAGEPVVWMLVLAGLLQLLTAPLSAHMVSRIAYRRRHLRRDLLVVDDAGPPLRRGPERGDEPADAPQPAEQPPAG
jgi:multicomponent Na+:H+ antiporter subunit G